MSESVVWQVNNGSATQEMQVLLEQSAARHQHLCPRQVLGVRMGMLAATVLGMSLPQKDKRLLTIVETDGCFADGVAVATGCELGHRTLRLVDYGRVAATFVDTVTGRAMRIAPDPTSRQTAADVCTTARSRWHAYLEAYQTMPLDRLFVVQEVHVNFSIADVVSTPDRRVICDECQEEVINGREVLREGKTLCRACADGGYYSSAVAACASMTVPELVPGGLP